MSEDRAGHGWVPGSRLFGEFVVERLLGSGGFGDVALVQSARTGEQYAAKQIRTDDPAAQGRFLAEAQRWLALPEHPNVNACRFLRSAENRLVIFSEYVVGGSLADGIRSRRIYEGAPEDVLNRVTGLAAQIARGLEAALDEGVLHLDVKPSNVLLSRDGTAKITDFGLASAGEPDVEHALEMEAVLDYIAGPDPDPWQREVIKSTLRDEFRRQRDPYELRVTAGGFSMAYASPEQAERAAVGPGADVWSWGVTVLEMFVGDRTWVSGTLAEPVLDQVLADGSATVPIPPGVEELLRAAFRADPAERPTLRLLADRLAGTSSGPANPPSAAPRRHPVNIRRVVSGGEWADPRHRLSQAYRLAGRDPRDAVPYWPSGTGTRRSRAVDELRALWQARSVLDDAPESAEVRRARAVVCHEMGIISAGVDDSAGARTALEQAVRAIGQPGDDEDRLVLVGVLVTLSITLRTSGSGKEAVERSLAAVELARRVRHHPDRERALATAMLTHANALGDHEAALAEYEEAVRLYRRAGDVGGEAKAAASMASSLAAAGRYAEAEPVFERAAARFAEIADARRHPDVAAALAFLLLNHAQVEPDPARRLERASEAAQMLRELVDEQGWLDLTGELGQAHFAVGRCQETLDRPRQALDSYRHAGILLERSVLRDGRADLADELANAYDHESTLVRDLESPAASVEVARRAVAMWQRLSEVDGEDAWASESASSRVKLGTALSDAGDLAAAAAEIQGVLESRSGNPPGKHPEIAARAHHAMGVVLRRAGHPADAVEHYGEGVHRLATEPDRHHHLRAVLLNSLGAALGDLARHREALRAMEAAAEEIARLPGAVQRMSDIADSRQRITNALVKLGEYERARDVAEEALRLYDELLAGGRSDLAADAARLRATHGVVLGRQYDFDGAAASFSRAQEMYRTGSAAGPAGLDLVGALDGFLEGVTKLRSMTSADVPAVVAETRGTIEVAAQLSRSGDADTASTLLEEVLEKLHVAADRVDSEEVLALYGQAGLRLGVTAMYCGRDGAARRGFATSIRCHDALLARGSTAEYLDAWCHGYVGLASLHQLDDDAAAAAAVIAEMDERLRALDRRGRRERVARARRMLAELSR